MQDGVAALSNADDIEALLLEVEQMILWQRWCCWVTVFYLSQYIIKDFDAIFLPGFIGLAVVLPLWYKMWNASMLFAVIGVGGGYVLCTEVKPAGAIGKIAARIMASGARGLILLGLAILSHMLASVTVYPLLAVIWGAW